MLGSVKDDWVREVLIGSAVSFLVTHVFPV